MSTRLRLSHQHPDVFCRQVSRLVDPLIKEILNLSVDEKRQRLVSYQVTAGGKRLRPALAVASCLACGGKIEDVLYAAAGLEILHNCTLIYDDMIDNSALRRGRATLWYRFGKSTAQCIGLVYNAAVFQAANRSRYPVEISGIFATALKVVVEGEIRDILLEQEGRNDEKYVVSHRYNEITQGDYLEMVGRKTAILIQASCEAGAVCAGAHGVKREALRQYGYNLGVAFQITDDILDVFGEEEKFGKEIGKDIEERKRGNIVIFYALDELRSAGEHKDLAGVLKKPKIGDTDIQKALELIRETGAEGRSCLLEEQYVGKAREGLLGMPDNEWSELLRQFADFVTARNS